MNVYVATATQSSSEGQLQHGGILSLVLQQLQPDQAVVCKLLSCSKAMANLVHRHCRGRLSARMPVGGTSSNSRSNNSWQVEARDLVCPTDILLGKWLAGNAMLLYSLHLDCIRDWPSSEQTISQGLAAAAAAAGEDSGCSEPGAMPAASGSSLLPLQHLTCGCSSEGDILVRLAGSAQLTSLQLRLPRHNGVPGCQAALAAFTGLKELTIGVHSQWISGGRVNASPGATPVFQELLPALRRSTQLTRLNLTPDKDASRPTNGVVLVPNAHAPALPEGMERHLPTSLVCLSLLLPDEAHPTVDLSHLTAITALRVEDMCEDTELPPNVVELTLQVPWTMAPLLPSKLPRLRQLYIHHYAYSDGGDPLHPEYMQVLKQLTQLEALHLDCTFTHHLSCEGTFPEDFSPLILLPVVELDLTAADSFPADFLGLVGSFSKLNRLALSQVGSRFEGVGVRALATQLPRLSALHELQLRVGGNPGPYGDLFMFHVEAVEVDWEVLLAAVAKVPSLRLVEFCSCELCAAAAQLAAATQLTWLSLEDCHVDGETRAALCAGLKQLLPEGLIVCCVTAPQLCFAGLHMRLPKLLKSTCFLRPGCVMSLLYPCACIQHLLLAHMCDGRLLQ